MAASLLSSCDPALNFEPLNLGGQHSSYCGCDHVVFTLYYATHAQDLEDESDSDDEPLPELES